MLLFNGNDTIVCALRQGITFVTVKNRPVLVTWFLLADLGLTYNIQIPKKLSVNHKSFYD